MSIRKFIRSITARTLNQVASKDNPLLCKACQVFDNAQDLFYFMEDADFVPIEIRLRNKQCIVCKALTSVLLQKYGVDNLDPLVASGIKIYVGSAFLVLPPNRRDPISERCSAIYYMSLDPGRKKPIKCVLYLRIHEDLLAPEPRLETEWTWGVPADISAQLLLFYETNLTRLNRVEFWNTPFLDIELAKTWFVTCEQEHGDRCRTTPTNLPNGFRLMYINQSCIVTPREPLPRFVALSYMWESLRDKDFMLVQDNLERLQQRGAMDVSELPDTIADTIQLCKALGERYLWVDKLCIVQDDRLSKHVQINAMDSIYGMAVLTIVSAVNSPRISGLPGICDHPRPSFVHNKTRRFHNELQCVDFNFATIVNGSAWNKRGWTFQERILSSRCLFITEYEIYFNCSELLCQEEVGMLSKSNNYGYLSHGDYSPPNIRELDHITRYVDAVADYSTRNFSFETDILNAFAGIANVMSETMNTPFLFGLPEKNLVEAMLWNHSNRIIRRKGVPDIPSWSWAAWNGLISYQFLNLPGISHIGTLVKFYAPDPDQAGEPRHLDVEEEWFGKNLKNYDELSFLNHPMHDNWKYLPTASESTSIWSACIHNPWIINVHTSLDTASCDLARKLSHSLVFNTTVAPMRLREQEPCKSDTAIVHLDLCDEGGHPIGHMESDREWLYQKVFSNEKQWFIVLCAGLLPKSIRRQLHWDQYFDKHRLDKDPWVLRGLLIERHEGLSRRLGIGYVETSLWNTAKPRWETIVLV